MKHYEQAEWLLYKDGLLPEDRCEEMEEHLMECTGCLELFLSLVSEVEVEQAAQLLKSDFTEQVMQNIKIQEIQIVNNPVQKSVGKISNSKVSKHKKSKKGKRTSMLAYYAAAASITLFFMGTGFFQALVETGPKLEALQAKVDNISQSKTELSWSEKITNQTSHWLREFERKDQGRL